MRAINVESTEAAARKDAKAEADMDPIVYGYMRSNLDGNRPTIDPDYDSKADIDIADGIIARRPL